MSLLYANTPGLISQPQSALAAGQYITSVPLSVIQSNTDFANVAVEVAYALLYDGDALPPVISLVDGYQFQASELVIHWERASTVANVGGNPAAAGGILEIADWIDPGSNTSLSTAYMVQGGATSDTNDGIMAAWVFGIRGRGLITIPSGLSFTYQADSVFATGNALTESILKALSASAQNAAVQFEVFTDAGQGTNWTAGWTPAVNAYGKPSWGRANGCYYQALEVVGPTAAVEPEDWPTAIGSILEDGGVLWVCVGRGFSNGQSFSMPTSPVDGHVYSSGELVACLTSWITTGQANLTGPSGSGRIQRLQKSAPGGVVSTTVTYWDGTVQTVTNDGVVHCVAIFMRTLPTYGAIPPAYNVFDGDEFMSGAVIGAVTGGQTSLQLLNQNVNNAACRPEGFLSTGKVSGGAPTLPTSRSGYSYTRAECWNVWELADTGSITGDYALRLWVMILDQASGLITCRVDYNQGGNQVTTTNGTLNVALVAARGLNVVLNNVLSIGTQGTPQPVAVGTDAVLNGSFETWTGLAHYGVQFVGVPTLWSISNQTADGYTTQQPGLDSAFSVGLDVGNAHAAANTQWVSLLSYPIAITPGDPYSFGILAKASPAISQGFIVRLHFRDINFANDVSADVIPGQALGTAISTFALRLTMPGDGDTLVQMDSGPVSLTGACPAQTTYMYVEIWNYKPNVSSAVICDDCSLVDLGGISDLVGAPNNTPAAPTLSYAAGGSLPATTYYVQTNYNARVGTTGGIAQTALSTEASIAVPSNNVLVVASPAQALNGASWNVYVATATGAETQQNTVAIAIGANWTEPTTGLVAGFLPGNLVGGTGLDAISSGAIFGRVKSVTSANQVSTGSIEDGAVSGSVAATLATQTALTYGSWQTEATVAITTANGVAFLSASGVIENGSTNPSSAQVNIQLYKGASPIGPAQNVMVGSLGATASFSALVIDTSPGAGSVTYTLQLDLVTNPGAYSVYADAGCTLSVINLKV